MTGAGMRDRTGALGWWLQTALIVLLTMSVRLLRAADRGLWLGE